VIGFRRKSRPDPSLVEIGNKLATEIETAIGEWRNDALRVWADMLVDSFEERIVGLVPEDGMTLDELVQIESMALMSNFLERREAYLREALAYFEPDTVVCIGLLGQPAGDGVAARIITTVREAAEGLSERLSGIVREEIGRRQTA